MMVVHPKKPAGRTHSLLTAVTLSYPKKIQEGFADKTIRQVWQIEDFPGWPAGEHGDVPGCRQKRKSE
jgi:hypothetical protein